MQPGENPFRMPCFLLISQCEHVLVSSPGNSWSSQQHLDHIRAATVTSNDMNLVSLSAGALRMRESVGLRTTMV